jgi:hypothetical protein
MNNNKLYKIWNKRTLYEIYFRPLPDTSKVEVITYFSGEPFCNPMSRRHLDKKDPEGNTEIWSVEDARENWDAWVNHGGYEVSEVEDYLQSGRTNSDGDSINHRKSINTTKENVTINGKPSSVAEVAKYLGMMNE